MTIAAIENPYHGVPYLLNHPIPTHLRSIERELVLTFDDGPHPSASGPILDILARRGVTATFFLVGHNVRRSPELVRRMAAEGHTLGNHTDTHPKLPEIPEDQVFEQLAACQASIEEAAGARPKVFRPTYGRYDERVLAACDKEGLIPVQWSAMVWDWLAPTPEESVAYLAPQLCPGAIILLHDGANTRLDSRDATINMLEPLLDLAEAQGYRWVDLSSQLDALA